jgi:hypothetical protein
VKRFFIGIGCFLVFLVIFGGLDSTTAVQLGVVVFLLTYPVVYIVVPVFRWMRDIIINIYQKKAEKDFIKKTIINDELPYRNNFRNENIYAGSGIDQPVLAPEHIRQLRKLRHRADARLLVKYFPMVSIKGEGLSNLVKEEGIFTANIAKDGKKAGVVIILANEAAVSLFLQAWYPGIERDGLFWVSGYLLPSKNAACLYVLYATALTINGKVVYDNT